MKYSYVLPIVAAVAYAQDELIQPEPFDTLPEIVKPYAQSLINVNDSTLALDAGILAFEGAAQAADLLQVSTALLNTIQEETTNVQGYATLENEDQDTVFPLATYVVNLGFFVNQTVVDLVNKKDVFVDACVGTVVLGQIQQQSDAADAFQSLVIAKLPETLRDLASGLASTIPVALASGVSAFADQTTVPASCSVTETSTTETSTSTSTSTGTGSGTGPKPTGGNGWEAETSFGPGYSASTKTYAPSSAPSNVYEWATVPVAPKPTTAPTYGSGSTATNSGKGHATTGAVPTYTGAANAHQIGGVAAVAAIVAAIF